MIDTKKAKWDLSKEENFAIDWLKRNGFIVTLYRQYMSKTIFTVERDGITENIEIPLTAKDMNLEKYMERFSKNWEVLRELRKLRKQVKK